MQRCGVQLREYRRRGGRKSIRSRGSGSLLWDCLLVISEDTHKVSPIWSSKRELPGATQNWHTKLDRAKLMKPLPYTKNYSQPSKVGHRRSGSPWGRAYQLVVQCQMTSPENIHIGNITWTEQSSSEIRGEEPVGTVQRVFIFVWLILYFRLSPTVLVLLGSYFVSFFSEEVLQIVSLS